MTGDDLKKARLNKGLSQTALAELCGRTQGWISQLESYKGRELPEASANFLRCYVKRKIAAVKSNCQFCGKRFEVTRANMSFCPQCNIHRRKSGLSKTKKCAVRGCKNKVTIKRGTGSGSGRRPIYCDEHAVKKKSRKVSAVFEGEPFLMKRFTTVMRNPLRRRNPDKEARELERQLAIEPDNLELQQKMLHEKLRGGRLDISNVLFRLAGFLGETAVRNFANDIGIKESWGVAAPTHKFPKLLIKRLLEGTDNISQTQKLNVIAGIIALLLPVMIPPNELGDYAGQMMILQEFTRTLEVPKLRVPYSHDPVPLLFWAIHSTSRKEATAKNLWQSYLEGAAEHSDWSAGFRSLLYKTYHERISHYLYSWDEPLLANLSLRSYLI